ncbi:AraC family transcriptional regulator [Alloactinosynnema sp. L-07]|uniref:helix-turn-helix domain-containing protein n=1 Tax=Alloactinosynnema sp. L-07 TaxID=1653480 RepID=UPI0008360768|nr:AraC family transcriptional regulator [Alloactinosynnema sp. L-07]
MGYRETSAGRPGIACLWSRTLDVPVEHRVVPDGCADVIWHRESGRLFVAGPDTTAQVGIGEPGTLIGLRFLPGAAAVGVPADAIRDGRVDLADFRADAGELADRLAHSPDPHRLLLDAFPVRPDPTVAAIRGLACRTGKVRDIADTIGLSERQLLRRSAAAFGYGPKVLHRVLRFDRALNAVRAGRPAGAVAYECGFADQAHLAREVKALAGTTLTELLGRGRAAS